jgi:hypothetical protein
MTRRAVRPTAAGGIQLFPFLAVLICTMGALVVVLVAMARLGQNQAMASAVAAQQASAEDIVAARESVEWEISRLNKSRQKTEAQVEEARLELSHIEDHLRRLRERAEKLQLSLREFQRSSQPDAVDQEETKQELERVKLRIVRLQVELEERHRRPKTISYSIVPYKGPNQTRRRPIYIECRADAVVLQPEGIELMEADFTGPKTAGKPLASAIRAEREYLAQSGQVGDKEPYPMLIVRPDGIAAYYAARAALTSYDSDFGYELVEKDWQLKYFPSDPQLAELLVKVVDEARQRQRTLARAAPRHYGRGGGMSSRPGSWGGPPPTRPYSGLNGVSGDDEWTPFAKKGETPGNSGQPTHTTVSDDAQASSQPNSKPAEQANAEKPKKPISKKPVESLAKQRGENWGLPDVSARAVAVTRPIIVECYPDRLVIVPDNANAPPKSVALGIHTEDAIDQLVTTVGDHMKGWGMAGKNLYWRPTLVMKVAPDATGRYVELKKLLEDSGLDVKQRGESTASASQNPLSR